MNDETITLKKSELKELLDKNTIQALFDSDTTIIKFINNEFNKNRRNLRCILADMNINFCALSACLYFYTRHISFVALLLVYGIFALYQWREISKEEKRGCLK